MNCPVLLHLYPSEYYLYSLNISAKNKIENDRSTTWNLAESDLQCACNDCVNKSYIENEREREKEPKYKQLNCDKIVQKCFNKCNRAEITVRYV